MAAAARVRVLWVRKVHPVDIPGGVRGKLEVGVRVTNTGTDTWESPDFTIRGHLDLADGRYIQDPAVEGITFLDPVAPDASLDHTIAFLSEPATAGVTSAQLFHPDTLVTVDVVQEGVAWLGESDGALVGQAYVRDAIRDRPVDVESAATRAGYRDVDHAKVAVPLSGSPLDVLFRQVPTGRTLYLLGLVLSATGAAQTLVLYQRPAGSAEEVVGEYRVPADQSVPIDLRMRMVAEADQYRLAVTPNPDGGQAIASLELVELPWAEQL